MSDRLYPTEIVVGGHAYAFERILASGFYSVNVLYKDDEGRRQVLKLSDFRFIFGFLLRPLASMISRHEYRIYSALADIPGVPPLGPRVGRSGYIHEFIEGRTLVEAASAELPDDFFDRLLAIFQEMHGRRIVYVDAENEGNIIVGTDGRPYLLDFHISIAFREPGGLLGQLRERLFATLVEIDIYHVYKHKRNHRRDLMRPEEWALAQRPRAVRVYESGFGKHTRWLKRRFYPSGSDATIWQKWRKTADKSRRMP
jgi:hypothetical protein